MILTKDNYFSKEASMDYCSASQYKDFIGFPAIPGCEARAMASIRGEYKRELSKSLLIGSVTDALWEGLTAEELMVRFPECVSTRGATKGELKSEYKLALKMYERTANDPVCSRYMAGDKQVIMTGEIEGLPFKIKMDSFDGRRITDFKTTEDNSKDFRKYVPEEGRRLPFYLYWGYDTQLAIYREICRQNTGETYPCYIVAVDKKEHPLPLVLNLEGYEIDEHGHAEHILDAALEKVKRNCERIAMVKSGAVEPLRCDCGKCDYCRDTYTCRIWSTAEFEAFGTSSDDE